MINKIKLLLLSGLVILPVGAFAQDYSFVDDGNGEYNPMSLDTDGGVFSNFSGTPNDSLGFGRLILSLNGNQLCSIYVYSSNSDMNEDSCNGLTLEAGHYMLEAMGASFTSASFSIIPASSGGGVVDPENPEIPLDVVGSFKTTLQGLVSDLVVGFYNYFPLVIVIGIGVLMIFTLRGYIRHASSEIFTLNKNSKKSLGWFQKEDIVNMYTNWKKDRVSKHDVNKIIENTVDQGYYEEDGVRYYTDVDKYKSDYYDFMDGKDIFSKDFSDQYIERESTHKYRGRKKKNI